jgi:cysteine desulfurase
MIYLDNNATTMVPPEVLEAMEPYYREMYGNPHSAHALGRRAHDGLENARKQVASLIGGNPEQLRFTSCGTESNALVIRGLRSKRKRMVATSVEHPSVLALLRRLHSAGEIELVMVGVDEHARVDLQAMRDAIDANTSLVCVMLAQNEVGTIEPVSEVAKMAHAAGALLLVDAVQAAGKIPIDVVELDADFLSLSGHKLHAPKGIGALYLRAGLELEPLWEGGGQEFGLRSGTEPVASAVGLGAAAAMAAEHLGEMSRVEELRDQFETFVLERCSFATANAAGATRLPNTSNISFDGLFGDEIVRVLDAERICASAGAACDSGKREPTGVMRAMQTPVSQALGAVRFSLSRYTTAEEIDRAASLVASLTKSMRSAQPMLQER